MSAGDDWSRYTPHHAVFSPDLAPSDRITSIDAEPGASRQAPHGLILATTSESRLYISTDRAQTFDEIRAR